MQDLAVGAPAEDVGAITNAGVVHVLYCRTVGLASFLDSELWFPGYAGLQGTPESFDAFGAALAAGDFDGNGCDDLVIGVPDSDAAAINMGKAYITYSNAYGITNENYGAFIQSELENGGTSEANDRFGFSLAVGNFNADEYADLVIGVPYEDQDYPIVIDAGAIDILWGSSVGLSGLDTKYLHQGLVAIADTVEADDRFGEVLAAIPSIWGKTFVPHVKR